jgi:hypothetical protein
MAYKTMVLVLFVPRKLSSFITFSRGVPTQPGILVLNATHGQAELYHAVGRGHLCGLVAAISQTGSQSPEEGIQLIHHPGCMVLTAPKEQAGL